MISFGLTLISGEMALHRHECMQTDAAPDRSTDETSTLRIADRRERRGSVQRVRMTQGQEPKAIERANAREPVLLYFFCISHPTPHQLPIY